MKILIFIEGNVLSQKDYSAVGGAGKKIATWSENGAEVEFLSGIYKFMEVKKLDDAVKALGIANPKIYAKQPDEKFLDIVEQVKPDVVIENKDNAGDGKTIAEQLGAEKLINAIVLAPGQTVEGLPDDPEELKEFGKKEEVAAVEDDAY